MDSNTPTPTWGAGVKVLRRLRGLTQAELATRIGCSQVTISKLELGSRKISDSMRLRVAKALDVNPYKLFPYESGNHDEDVA